MTQSISGCLEISSPDELIQNSSVEPQADSWVETKELFAKISQEWL